MSNMRFSTQTVYSGRPSFNEPSIERRIQTTVDKLQDEQQAEILQIIPISVTPSGFTISVIILYKYPVTPDQTVQGD